MTMCKPKSIEVKTLSKITVTYEASAQLGNSYQTEKIHLQVEIDNFHDYPDTLDLLRSKVLEKLDLKQQHDDIKSNYKQASKKLERLTKLIEKAQKDWETARNFMVSQGLKNDVDLAEFPTEALTNLSKSLPTSSSGYPE